GAVTDRIRNCIRSEKRQTRPTKDFREAVMLHIADKAAFQNSLADLPVVTYQSGETVIIDGSKTDRLLILKKGNVAIVKGDTEIAKVAEPGAVFGELSVLLGQPHTADVHALQTSGVFEDLAAGEDSTGLGLQEQLGHTARLQPVRVSIHDRSHVGGVALDGDLSGPRQRRPSALPGFGERPRVFRHFLVGELAQDCPWQDLLNEEVVLEDHLLAGLGTQRLQDWAHSELVPVVPILPPHHRLHIRDALHGIAVAVGPVEAESRTPVMDDQGDALAHIQSLEQGVEVTTVLDEPIRARPTVSQLVGIAHADQVGGNAAA